MQELYFERLDKLGLLEQLNEVPIGIQRRRNGFTPAQRCLTLLAAQAQRCHRVTDWTLCQRLDSRLQHWLGGRAAPHPSTISRTLAACDEQTVRVMRQKILVPLTDQVLHSEQAQGRWVFFDIDNKSLPAEGEEYEGTQTGRMSDGGFCRGYRLHMISLANTWPLEMEFTGANAHAVPCAMVMFKRLAHRIHGSLRFRMVVRGDSNHGSVRFIIFLDRYKAGYLLKCYNPSMAKKLWEEHADEPPRRIVRPGKIDLLAIDLGPTRLTGMTRKKLANGKELRKPCQVVVPRVVVYREDQAQVPSEKTPECFALFTTLPAGQFHPETLLAEPQARGETFDPGTLLTHAYQPRAGDIENIFCQLDQAFEITHMRSRTFYGNYTFLMLSLIAATLTQMIRHESHLEQQPIPAGIKETLTAAADSGLRLEHDNQAGCVLVIGLTSPYTKTFQKLLRCSHQHRFRYAA
jgi:hypothetical protein